MFIMGKLIMGIDGGGTKGHLGLFDADGKRVGVSSWGPLNHEVLEGSFTQLEAELARFIHGALESAGASMDEIDYAVLGVAGVDTQSQHETISGILRRIGLSRFTLCNDGYLGVAAGCPGGVGICAINGTGSVLTAIDGKGVMRQLGGIGAFSDDCGGSGWYGTQVLGAVYRELYKYGPATALRQMLFDKLGITQRDEYTETVTAGVENGTLMIHELNRLVFSAANAGDAVAAGILETSAEHYAGCISFFARELDFPDDRPLYITLAGSVFVKEKVDILPRLIHERVCAMLEGRPVEFVTLKVPPVAGAVAWALRQAGADANPEEIRAALAEL
jgi:N-acetylglucosamine kinase-like BadF-type ATPase